MAAIVCEKRCVMGVRIHSCVWCVCGVGGVHVDRRGPTILCSGGRVINFHEGNQCGGLVLFLYSKLFYSILMLTLL